MAALKHFRAMTDFSAAELRQVLDLGIRLKSVPRADQATLLAGRYDIVNEYMCDC
eukprot:m.76513 g.76513  ORF g.76513 m.76513 type:complete len:55 (+) comp9066_c0_seq1:140-304(+)